MLLIENIVNLKIIFAKHFLSLANIRLTQNFVATLYTKTFNCTNKSFLDKRRETYIKWKNKKRTRILRNYIFN